MTDKEFKRLKRSDLISVIYEYQKKQEELEREIEELKAQLEEKTLRISDFGSIAEAVVGLNELFETAQKTADEYIEQVRLASGDAEKKAQEIIAEARQKAEEIVSKAQTDTPAEGEEKAE